MNSIPFPGANLKIGANQTDTYNVLHAMVLPGPEAEIIICFELTDEEVESIREGKKLYYRRMTFGQRCSHCGKQNGFQPMRIETDLSDGVELLPE